MEKAMINLTINDRPIEVPEGTTVLEAARKLGLNIPTLCHFEGLKPYGGCRLCMVEVTNGPRTQLTTSCTYPVAEGLTVQTDTEEVQEGRRFVMDLLLSRCPEVPALQDMAQELGLAEPTYPKGESDCILCGKCVRMCHEVQHASAIAMMGRGAKRGGHDPLRGFFHDLPHLRGLPLRLSHRPYQRPGGQISGKTPKPKFSEFNAKLVSQGNIYPSLSPGGAQRPPPSTPRIASSCSPATAASAPKSVPPAPSITSRKMKPSPWRWGRSSWRPVSNPLIPAASRPTATASSPMSIPASNLSAS